MTKNSFVAEVTFKLTDLYLTNIYNIITDWMKRQGY